MVVFFLNGVYFLGASGPCVSQWKEVIGQDEMTSSIFSWLCLVLPVTTPSCRCVHKAAVLREYAHWH